MEVVALIVSILAFVLAAIVAFVEYKRDYNITKINLEHDYYRIIFQKYLLYKIPAARKVIWLNKNRQIVHAEKLAGVLAAMRKDALFFVYHNKRFYSCLKEHLQQLEDFLVLSGDKVLPVGDEVDFFSKLEQDLSEIYELISRASCGMNVD